MTKREIILNADDLGFSAGVNQAVLMAHRDGFLTHASLMANTDFFEEAVSVILPQCSGLKVGVHVNLTCAPALFSENVLTENGVLRNNFVKLLFKYKSKKVLESLEKEIELQILKIKERGIQITHIDGHEHVHIIPSINKIVRKLAAKYKIPRVREINESFTASFKYNLRTAGISNVIKLFLLKFLSLFNGNSRKVHFYSILNTCEINAENLFNYLENTGDRSVEIMVHPGIPKLDKGLGNLDQRFVSFLQSDFRTQELEVCLNNKFSEYF